MQLDNITMQKLIVPLRAENPDLHDPKTCTHKR